MEKDMETYQEEFEFPEFIETHGAPPNNIIPLCRSYIKENEHIMSINEEKIRQLASDIVDGSIYLNKNLLKEGKNHVDELFDSDTKKCLSQMTDNKTRVGDIARIIAYNVVNFSFYPDKEEVPWWIEIEKGGEKVLVGKDDEFFAITSSFERAEQTFIKAGDASKYGITDEDTGKIWCNYEYLSTLNIEKLEEIFKPAPDAGKLPLLQLRLNCIHSLAELYKKMSLEEFIHLCEEKSVQKEDGQEEKTIDVGIFISLLTKYVPAFRDYRSDIPFSKRPQLTIAMLHKNNLISFSDLENLTVFSDYRLPQLFISKGVFEFHDASADRRNIMRDIIEKQTPIKAHSKLEICLRCGSIVVAEELRTELCKLTGNEVKIANLDYYLWRTCVLLDSKELLLPHHRTRTFCY